MSEEPARLILLPLCPLVSAAVNAAAGARAAFHAARCCESVAVSATRSMGARGLLASLGTHRLPSGGRCFDRLTL